MIGLVSVPKSTQTEELVKHVKDSTLIVPIGVGSLNISSQKCHTMVFDKISESFIDYTHLPKISRNILWLPPEDAFADLSVINWSAIDIIIYPSEHIKNIISKFDLRFFDRVRQEIINPIVLPLEECDKRFDLEKTCITGDFTYEHIMNFKLTHVYGLPSNAGLAMVAKDRGLLWYGKEGLEGLNVWLSDKGYVDCGMLMCDWFTYIKAMMFGCKLVGNELIRRTFNDVCWTLDNLEQWENILVNGN